MNLFTNVFEMASPAIGLVSFLLMMVFTPLVIRMAHRFGWVAKPRGDRWHTKPTALMGGIAIYAAAMAANLLLNGGIPPWMAIGCTIMFLTGVIDDRLDLKPSVKLLAQVVAAGLPLYSGASFAGLPVFVSLPLTLIWVIGITNAVNLIDGMDGLASGLSTIAAAVLAALAWQLGDTTTAKMAASVVGAAAGFLVFNFKPARIFMGDGGSLFLGYSLAILSLDVQSQATGNNQLVVLFVPFAILAVPIFDTTLVTISRVMHGRSITQGGIDHSMHRLVLLGLSERRAVAVLWFIGSVFGGLSLLLFNANKWLAVSIGAFLVSGLIMVGVYLFTVDVYARSRKGDFASSPAPLAAKICTVLYAFFGREWKSAFGMLADLVLIVAAYILAYDIRFEGRLPEAQMAMIVRHLPLLILVKIPVFYLSGLYRGIWRHAGTMELFRVALASMVATSAAAIVIGVASPGLLLSSSVFIIDWLLVVMALLSIRFGFRALRQFIGVHRSNGRKVLLYGAGDAGSLTLRELRQNPEHELIPVGFIDDDPLKKGLTLHGLQIVGAFRDLPLLCSRHEISEVIISANRMTPARKAAIREACEDLGVKCRMMEMRLMPVTYTTEATSEATIHYLSA